MVTEVDAATALVVTVKVTLVAPAGTVTLEGTLANAVLLLESRTWASPAGAGPAQGHRARGGLYAADDTRRVSAPAKRRLVR